MAPLMNAHYLSRSKFYREVQAMTGLGTNLDHLQLSLHIKAESVTLGLTLDN